MGDGIFHQKWCFSGGGNFLQVGFVVTMGVVTESSVVHKRLYVSVEPVGSVEFCVIAKPYAKIYMPICSDDLLVSVRYFFCIRTVVLSYACVFSSFTA